MAIDSNDQAELPEGSEYLKQNRATKVMLLGDGDEFVVMVEGEVVTRTRIHALAVADFDAAVEDRMGPFRARLDRERAAGAYAAMASENGVARSSKAQRGGKGGRGGV